MKALVFNARPNMEKGNTALILNPFIEGMKEEGAEAELLYVRELKVTPVRVNRAAGSEHPEDAFRMTACKMSTRNCNRPT